MGIGVTAALSSGGAVGVAGAVEGAGDDVDEVEGGAGDAGDDGGIAGDGGATIAMRLVRVTTYAPVPTTPRAAKAAMTSAPRLRDAGAAAEDKLAAGDGAAIAPCDGLDVAATAVAADPLEARDAE